MTAFFTLITLTLLLKEQDCSRISDLERQLKNNPGHTIMKGMKGWDDGTCVTQPFNQTIR